MTKKRKLILAICITLSVAILATSLYLFLHVLPEYKKQREWQLAVQQYYQNKVATYEQENKLYEDYEVDVAFLGDSLTDGYDLAQYYPQFKTVNRGIGGDTTFGLEQRLQVSAYDLKPKVVVMLIGANNFKTMFENYENIVKGLKTNLPDTKLVLLSLTSMSMNWGRNNELACFNNVKIKIIAEKYGCEYVDLFTPLFDFEANELRAEYTVDGGHFTAQGYEVLTQTITPVLETLLSKYPPQTKKSRSKQQKKQPLWKIPQRLFSFNQICLRAIQ